jgi:hypothetical protein
MIFGVKSPWLVPNRLADVLRAIQFLGTYPGWSAVSVEALTKKPDDFMGRSGSGGWERVFAEHHEFFASRTNKTVDGREEQVFGLAWRRAQMATFDVREGKNYTLEQSKLRQKQLGDQAFYSRTTTPPLRLAQIKVLLKTAIDLHDRASARRKERQALSIGAMTLVGSTIGALLGTSAHRIAERMAELLGW